MPRLVRPSASAETLNRFGQLSGWEYVKNRLGGLQARKQKSLEIPKSQGLWQRRTRFKGGLEMFGVWKIRGCGFRI